MEKEKKKEKSAGSGSSAFLKQCFVTASVAVNVMGHGSVIGFSAVLIPQLRLPTSYISMTDSEASWVASVIGFALLVGNPITPVMMAKVGRKKAHMAATIPILIGWFIVILATSVKWLIVARFMQGLSMGMMGPLGSVLIGEYTSPRNRGAFLTCISLALSLGVLLTHTVGSFISWQRTALFCTIFSFSSIIMQFYAPESPSWLASEGRYDECRSEFRWLRGEDDPEEEDELFAMIEASQETRSLIITGQSNSLRKSTARGVVYLKETVKKKEFYKPVILMIHLYTMFQFAGINVLSSYMTDIIRTVVGPDAKAEFWMIALDVLRLVANVIAIFLMKTVKRRTLLFSTGSLCVLCILSISGYIYAKQHNMLPITGQWLPILLINVYMFALATGMAPLPFTLAGEVFPLEYRSLGGGLSVLPLSLMFFVAVKCFPVLTMAIGMHGAYLLYACVVTYCLVVAWFILPETKGRTLQEIENELRGTKVTPEELRAMQSQQSVRSHAYHLARRCSNPVVY